MAQHGPESKTRPSPSGLSPPSRPAPTTERRVHPCSLHRAPRIYSPPPVSCDRFKDQERTASKESPACSGKPRAGLGLRALGSGPGTLRSSSGNARWASPGGPADAAFDASCGRALWTLLARPLPSAPLLRGRWDPQGGCARGPGPEPARGDWSARRARRAGGRSFSSFPGAFALGAASRSFQQGVKGGQQRQVRSPGGSGWPARAPLPRLGTRASPSAPLAAPRTPTRQQGQPPSPRAGSRPRGRGRREQDREGSRGATSGAARAVAAGKASPGALRSAPPDPAAGSGRALPGGVWPGPADSVPLRRETPAVPHPHPRPRGRPPGPGAAFLEAAAEIRTRPSGALVAFWRNQARSSGSLCPSLTLESARVCFCHPRRTPILRPMFLPRSRGAETAVQPVPAKVQKGTVCVVR